MAAFLTKLELCGKAFGISGGLDYRVIDLTVGQIRVIQTHRKAKYHKEPTYKEEYMCFETGVDSGTVWTYGKNIFATEAEAQVGIVARHKEMKKERAERDARVAKKAAEDRARDLDDLARLKAKYECA